MQKKINMVLAVAGGIILVALLFAGYIISQYNNIIGLEETTKQAWAQVENQLKRRSDLIPNLVNTVKGYASHEKEIFENVAQARSKLAGAGTISQKIGAAQEMEGALSRLLAIAENYPALKADTTFNRLMDELAGTENRIAVERRRYNLAVETYNRSIKVFPGRIFAAFFGFKEAAYFQATEQEKAVPTVNFN